jgi:hypothetical protein
MPENEKISKNDLKYKGEKNEKITCSLACFAYDPPRCFGFL